VTLAGRGGGDSWRKASEESLDLGDAFSEAMGGRQHRGQYPRWSRRPFSATLSHDSPLGKIILDVDGRKTDGRSDD